MAENKKMAKGLMARDKMAKANLSLIHSLVRLHLFVNKIGL